MTHLQRPGPSERIRGSLTLKLFLAQLLVIVAGSLTLLLVAVSVAPGVFNGHVRDVPGTLSPSVVRHVEQGFRDAVLVALGVATAAAFLTALAVSWFVSRRLVRPIGELAAAARSVARGAYSERSPVAGSDELAVLARAFNDMASSLESAEGRRRELLTDVAHELRTPLATIDGYLEGLADGVVAADADTLNVLGTETRRLRRLVEDLEKVSRAEARQLDLRIVPTPAAELAEAAAAAMAPAFQAKGVALTWRADEGLPRLPVDRDRLGEVLANLLDNALRHTPKGGSVELGATHRGDVLELSVSDTGEGIAPDRLEAVFERFFREDAARSRASGGSGVGLTIARAITEAHGGRIRALSAGKERGARFIVTLPLSRRVGAAKRH